MAIVPVRQRDRARAAAANQLGHAARMVRARANGPIRQPQVLTPGHSQYAPGLLRFQHALFRSAVGGQFAPGEIAQSNGVAERRMLGQRPAESDLQIVGVRPECQHVYRRHRIDYSLIRVNENGSSPFSGFPR